MATLDSLLKFTANTIGTIKTNIGGLASGGALEISKGGTGATSASAARQNLGAASASHTHSASDLSIGTIAINSGGTGATSASGARTALGFTYGTSTPSSAPSTGTGSVYFKII